MILEIKHILKTHIEDIVESKYNEKVNIVIEKPKSEELGDLSIPVFMLAKIAKKSPVDIATTIADEINLDIIDKVNVVNGFINVFLLREEFTLKTVGKVLAEGSDYANGQGNSDKTVLVEYSSPNIAKPFHIGHIRTTIIGAALYKAFKKCGYNTIGINHLGDYGTQFGKLIVAIKAWGDKDQIQSDPIPELLKLYIKFHEEAEKHPELDEEARGWFTKLENGDKEAEELWNWIREVSLLEFERVYDMFDIEFDSYAGESFYSDKMPAVLDEMRAKNVIIKDSGAEIVNLEEHGMPNALITKSDGSTMYITRDLAAAQYRHDHYNFYKNVYVVGHQQELHFKQWMKIHEIMGHEWVKDCKHVTFGMVSLEDGSLSTRAGRVLFLEDVLNKAIEKSGEILEEKNPNIKNKELVNKQIGIGAVVFQELFISRKKDYAFSWEKTLNFEGETGPYIQYTGVRIKSLLRNATTVNLPKIDNLVVSQELWNITMLLMSFEEVLNTTIDKYDPSQLARYVLNIAAEFNKFYTSTKVFVDDETIKQFNLAFCKAVLTVLEEGLRILGMSIPDEM